MRKGQRGVVIVLGTLVLLGAAGAALAYSGGPPNALTNAPGEGNCTACHGSFPLNSGSGSLDLGGAPDAYQTGTTYTLTVDLADPAASRWGFELTALDADGNSAGSLVPVDTETQASTGGAFGRQYLKQTAFGSHSGTVGQSTWTFQWTTPATPVGSVTFYLVGNAANGNGSTSGDRIYATAARVPMVSTTDVVPLSLARLHPNRPNPFNPRTELRFSLARTEAVRLDVYDLRGRRIRVLVAGTLPAGEHAVTWDGTDDTGRGVTGGVYLARLVTPSGNGTRRMSLVR